MQKRIILTGSNGLLGQKVVTLLADRVSVQLIATARGINRHPIREGYTYKSVDLTDKAAWEALFEEFKPTELINTAAMTQVDHCEVEKEKCDAINVKAVADFAELCKKYNTRLIHISTDFVFDGEDGPYTETDQPNPLSYYGNSKLQAENAIINSGVDHAILRTMLIYGITPGMSRSNLVLWVRKSLLEGQNIRVVGDQFRCPTLAEDLARATVSAVMNHAKGLFHVSGAEMMSIIDIAYRVADFWKLDKSLITEIDSLSLNQKAKRPPKTGFLILKAQTELNYKPHSLEQGLGLVSRQIKDGWG